MPRRRPLWLVAALTALSLGIYLPLWLGLSWLELRRETADDRMQPLWHALSLFVPGYGYWQAYQHFRLLGDQLARVGGAGKVDPLSATLGVVLWSMTFLHYSTEPLFVLLDAIELLAAIGVVVYGQRALNEYWRARPGAAVAERLVDTDLLAIARFGRRPIDLAGLERRPGRSFHWFGRYDFELNAAETLNTDLGVFADWQPRVPAAFADSEFVFLANILPEIQLGLLEQVRRP